MSAAVEHSSEKFRFDPPRVAVNAPIPAVPLGAATIHQIPELAYKMPVSLLTSDAELLRRNAHWLKPRFVDADDQWELVVQSWLVIVDDRVILIDPCTGNGRSNPNLPMQHMIDVPYIERLQARGFRPQDVDIVFCTHLHGDHCGWNTELRSGRFVPTFPNARYLMVQREFDRWDTRRADHHDEPANVGVFENSIQPVLDAGLVDLVQGAHSICKSVEIEPAYGHTHGHCLVHLASAGRDAYFTGDAIHHPLEVKYPTLDQGACEEFAAALATRHKIIGDCIDKKALFVPAHFAAPHLGFIRDGAQGSMFEPYVF